MAVYIQLPMIFVAILALQAGLLDAVLHDHQQHPHLILLNARSIDTRHEPQFHEEDSSRSHFTQLSLDERMASTKPATFLMHVSSDPDDRKALAEHVEHQHQMQLLEYLPHNTFIVEGTHETMAELQKRHDIVWIGYLKPDDKIGVKSDDPNHHPGFEDNNGMVYVLNTTVDNSPPELVVSLTKVAPKRPVEVIEAVADEIRDLLTIAGELTQPDKLVVRAVYSNTNRINVELGCSQDRDAAEALIAKIPIVARVERRQPVKLSNKWARGIIQAGRESAADLQQAQNLLSSRHNLRGQNQVVGLSDSGLDIDNCFLQDVGGPSPFVKHFSNRMPTRADLNQEALRSARKVVSYVTFGDSSDSSGHGTHVSGSIAGLPDTDDVAFHEYAGSAPDAKLAFFDLGVTQNGKEGLRVPSDLGSYLLHWAYESGARVHSNSWGSNSAAYTSDAQDMDEYMWEHKDFIVLVAAGNSGECLQSKSIGSPSTAKSVITVGASMSNTDAYEGTGFSPPFFQKNKELFDEDDLAYFSSIGPTDDGRIKPDVVAPGFGIWSASNGGGSCSKGISSTVQVMSGTSMATPLLAGSVTLVRQYFSEGFFPSGKREKEHEFSPSGSLMKAVTIAGAVAMRGTRISYGDKCETKAYSFKDSSFPNNHHGWGRPQLDRVLEFADDPSSAAFHLHIPTLDKSRTSTFGDEAFTRSSQSSTYKFCARSVHPDAAAESSSSTVVRVALVWTDAPGNSGAAVALVNDLDLEVVYKGKTYRGNGKDTADRLNPVEVVELTIDGSASDIDVRVNAKAINVGTQPFSVVVVGAVRQASCEQLAKGGVISDGKQPGGSDAAKPPVMPPAPPAAQPTPKPTQPQKEQPDADEPDCEEEPTTTTKPPCKDKNKKKEEVVKKDGAL